jgi:hypothetical protein
MRSMIISMMIGKVNEKRGEDKRNKRIPLSILSSVTQSMHVISHAFESQENAGQT